ncbi:long-chain acyl-CoA synthetase [Dietzia sp. 2505]|uniref:acyl-CoA synthetase n=1 Tax=Dietzia sp. 2505 TaxID=3156457 RepID=UPI00339AD288
MFPGTFAATTPDKPAVIRPATGEQITYAELEARSAQLAHVLTDDWGLRPGDTIAVVSDNTLEMVEIYWGALRVGLYIAAINHHLTAEESSYIIGDCGARALFVSAPVADHVDLSADAHPDVEHRVVFDGTLDGFADYRDLLADKPTDPPADQPRGHDFLYSSGTTGRPKGVRVDPPEGQIDEVPDVYTPVFSFLYAFDADSVYLCPAPLYHAAPLRFCGVVNSVGGTVILMDRFDAEESLRLIEEYRVTHSQWVPTMFVRMLKLPEETRERYDVSSMTHAIHAAAPCPPEVKRRMIEWWGPVIHEYYSATEGMGITFINSQEALERPGSVGRDGLKGIAHICDEEGRELPIGEIGSIYWQQDEGTFTYHGDPEKTASVFHPEHPNWSTFGDVGYLDSDRFLYLTDRKAFTIISGGVNIYPQEIENALALHPAVEDVAVIGIPDEEMGEKVHAVVVPAPDRADDPDLGEDILGSLRGHISDFKIPRAVDFVDELPRTPTGKLVKRRILDRYTSGTVA